MAASFLVTIGRFFFLKVNLVNRSFTYAVLAAMSWGYLGLVTFSNIR